MEPRTRVFVLMFVLVGLIGGMYIFTQWFSKTTGYVLGEDQKLALADCLLEKSTILYMATDCAECEKQRTLLGEAMYARLKPIECAGKTCPNIRTAPAWYINGEIYYGMKDFEDLGILSDCPLPSMN